MYDKLGDLLSVALDSGFILNSQETSDSLDSKQTEFKTETAVSKARKTLSEKQKSAFQAITIPFEADFETAKKIFHEKLMYYHPDRRNDNAVLQKIAREKTENLLNNWQIVESFFKTEG